MIDNVITPVIGSVIGSINGGTNGGAQFMASFNKRRIVTDDNVIDGVFDLSGSYVNNIIETNSNYIIKIRIPNDMLLGDGKVIGVRMAQDARICEVIADTNITVNGEVGGRRFYPKSGEMLFIVGRGNGNYDIVNARRKPDSAREAADMVIAIRGEAVDNWTETVAGNGIVDSYRDREASNNSNLQPVLSRSRLGD
jgi:hypothetical protein